ncbi:class I SAM-dependent methyltransferase [Sphingobium lignivorans]|uniref:SAM-dependent methyltransferase n=1 Tax=Sphingobium lignivorans TaxID=2735886 RepID=A0ABR6NGM5_9SPHN|nr:class I SAM-dependent methyltransferase [Sphingobium lignivorans]MBB5985658.1 SAM-dependent methyltransferase [Sphingobium lignivorans]
MTNAHYSGEGGDHFLAQRGEAATDRVQMQRATLFGDVARPDARTVDFGCGTGGILERLPASYRAGVEIGESAAEVARSRGIDVVSSLDELAPGSFDLAISFHAIEHVDYPLDVLVAIARVVKPNGLIRLVVPCEMPTARMHRSWRENDYQHLHTWTPLNFGNLAKRAGYRDIQVRLVPMPTGSRLVKALSPVPPLQRLAHRAMSVRRNNFNVVLDASPPMPGTVAPEGHH